MGQACILTIKPIRASAWRRSPAHPRDAAILSRFGRQGKRVFRCCECGGRAPRRHLASSADVTVAAACGRTTLKLPSPRLVASARDTAGSTQPMADGTQYT